MGTTVNVLQTGYNGDGLPSECIISRPHDCPVNRALPPSVQGLAALGFRLRFCKRSLLPPVDSALRPWAFASTFASVYCGPHLSAPRDHLPLRGPTATPKFRLQG